MMRRTAIFIGEGEEGRGGIFIRAKIREHFNIFARYQVHIISSPLLLPLLRENIFNVWDTPG